MTRLLLVRHALCEGVGDRLIGRTPGVSLDDRGRAQARELAAMLRHEPITAVHTSPVQRAVETAVALAEPHGLEPAGQEAFTEVDFGDWTGRTIRDLEGDPTWRDFNTMRGTTRIPGGELMAETQLRAVRGLLQVAGEHAGETVAVVSHADVLRALLTHLLGMPLDHMLRLEVAPASVSTVVLHGTWPQVLALNRQAP